MREVAQSGERPSRLGEPLSDGEGRLVRGVDSAAEVSRKLPPPPMRFSARRVLGKGFGILMRNFLGIFSVGALVYLPKAVLQVTALLAPDSDANVHVLALLSTVLTVTLPFLFQGVLAAGVISVMRGESTGLLGGLGVGLRRIHAVLGVISIFLLVGLALAVLFLVVFGGVGTGRPTVLGPLGSLLLLVPIFLLSCLFYVAVPVAVLEHAGPRKALRRSATLTRGRRLPIAFILIALGLMALFTRSLALQALGVSSLGMSAPLVAAPVDWVVSIFFAASQAVCVSVAYQVLREMEAGSEIDAAAAVFD